MRQFGLIGKSLVHSFSKQYFEKKFLNENLLDCQFNLFELGSLNELPRLIDRNPQLQGFSVTIPFKESILPYLFFKDPIVEKTGACNCVKVFEGKLYGYNTDIHGFTNSLKPHLKKSRQKAIILGNGGASKAVAFSLASMNIEFTIFARNPQSLKEQAWEHLQQLTENDFQILINTTPVGTWPNIEDELAIDYTLFNAGHIVFDLIYNPIKTKLLFEASSRKANAINGLEMLHLQAEKAWEYWNTPLSIK